MSKRLGEIAVPCDPAQCTASCSRGSSRRSASSRTERAEARPGARRCRRWLGSHVPASELGQGPASRRELGNGRAGGSLPRRRGAPTPAIEGSFSRAGRRGDRCFATPSSPPSSMPPARAGCSPTPTPGRSRSSSCGGGGEAAGWLAPGRSRPTSSGSRWPSSSPTSSSPAGPRTGGGGGDDRVRRVRRDAACVGSGGEGLRALRQRRERMDHSTADDLIRVFHLITSNMALADHPCVGFLQPELARRVLFWALATVLINVLRSCARAFCRRRMQLCRTPSSSAGQRRAVRGAETAPPCRVRREPRRLRRRGISRAP